jgi:ribosomal protein L28
MLHSGSNQRNADILFDSQNICQNIHFITFITLMARMCGLCGRGALNVNSRSHSNIATSRRQHVNLQTLFLNGRRVDACTSCIRRETKKLRDLSKKKTAAPATA